MPISAVVELKTNKPRPNPLGSKSHLRLHVGVSAGGVRELNEARWSDALTKALRDCGHGESDLAQTLPSTPWKIAVAAKLRQQAAAPYRWIAQKLVVSVKFCKSGSVVRGFGEIKRFMGRV